jgi:hypothetical protein
MDKETLNKLKELDVDVAGIPNERTRGEVVLLLNGLESFASEVEQLKEENHHLKDELNRLKGEQGKPAIREQSKSSEDHSSEKERKPPESQKKPRKPKHKKHKIKIHKREICRMDRLALPQDAEFKGYDYTTIQGIQFQAHNIEFKREVWHSRTEKKRYLASLPDGYQGEFSPQLKALVIELHYGCKVSEPGIHRLLTDVGTHISLATISRILTDKDSVLHKEKADIVAAGRQSLDYQQIDDTSARVNGRNHYTHVLCNPCYTAYFTRPHKDRLTVLEILKGSPLGFVLNEQAFTLMQALKVPEVHLEKLKVMVQPLSEAELNRAQIDQLLNVLFPDPNKHIRTRTRLLEAAALTAYRQQEDAIEILVCDDAPQFKSLTEYLALCWVHEGRHYKKLKPFKTVCQRQRDEFLTAFWAYYHRLVDYQQAPTDEKKHSLEKEFDILFSKTTGYTDLDERIQKTRAKKDSLLLVLKYPPLPLHNNASELGARRQAQYRDISLQTKTPAGTDFKDSAMTVEQTAKKLGVSFLHYLHDRICGIFSMTSLADLVVAMAKQHAPAYNHSI